MAFRTVKRSARRPASPSHIVRVLAPVVLGWATTAFAAGPIPWDQAEQHVGEETAVQGRVLGVRCSLLSCLLAFDPTFNRFTAVDIVARTGCNQLHASLRGQRKDRSVAARPQVSFGSAVRWPEDRYDATDAEAVAQLRAQLGGMDESAGP